MYIIIHNYNYMCNYLSVQTIFCHFCWVLTVTSCDPHPNLLHSDLDLRVDVRTDRTVGK